MAQQNEHLHKNGIAENGLSEGEGYLPFPKGFATAAIHHSQEPEQWDSMSVVTPIVMSTTFKQYSPANFKKYEYGRSNNPTREVLENVLAKLDNGLYGLTFASGLGAITAIVGLLESGDNIIMGDDVYGGTNRLFNKIISRYNIEISVIDLVDLDNLQKALKPNTKLIWVETPTNPTFKVIDIQGAADIAKRHNILLAVDNTFQTPYLQRPLDLGADLVVYSLTKYMNGHSDVIMGSISTSNKELYEKLKFLQNAMGIVPSPMDCYQVNRSLKTLALRMQQHQKNALVVAKYLEGHAKVEKVLHPGLPSHPQYELYKKQTSGHSGVLSFYLRGGLDESNLFLSSLKIITLGESLGGYESLAELPSVMTHSSVPPEQRVTLGISDNLIRISVGLEDIEDIIADLKQGLAKLNKVQYVKGRLVNPTRSALEHLLALLNKAKYGLCFSSGLGAVTAVMGLLKHGDHVICTDDLYAGTTRLFYEMAPRFGINTSFIDFDDLNNVRDAIKPETKLIWTENPTNPKMKIVDLFCISELSREQNILVTNDNTLLTPYFQRPLEYGVDIVVHSLSKYLNGHSDVIMGCVCTNSKDLFQKMRYLQTHFGHVPSPFDCFQVIRGIKTFPQRMIRHHQNALEVAKYLSDHPKIEQVMHPGLTSHPQHALFKKQTSGHSGMFSFYLKGGIEETNKLLSNLEVFTQAVSFGGYESLIEVPSLLSHKSTPQELKDKLKYTENLLRISVGLENVCDLINDLDKALKKV